MHDALTHESPKLRHPSRCIARPWRSLEELLAEVQMKGDRDALTRQHGRGGDGTGGEMHLERWVSWVLVRPKLMLAMDSCMDAGSW